MFPRSCVALLSLAVPLWAQNVHVVDDAGGAGVDFTSIASAVAAAANGDIVLVRSGEYVEDVTIDAKSLVVTADAGALVDYEGNFVVRNLAAGQSVVWSGFDAGPPIPGYPFSALEISNNAGPVWIDDVRLSAAKFHQIPHMVGVSDSDSVFFVDCLIHGGTLASGPGNPGLRATDSDVYVYDSSITGGWGYQGLGAPFDGGTGVELNGGTLFAMSSTIQGGKGTSVGGSPVFGCTGTAGDGGTGLHLDGSNPAADLYDTTVLGGPAGDVTGDPGGTCNPGFDGVALIVDAGVVNQTAWAARDYAVTSPVRTNEAVGVTLTGQPNDLAWIAFSTATAVQPFAAIVGPLAVGAPLVLPIGNLGATGALAFSVTTFVPPGFEGLTYYSQALFVDTVGNATLSEPAPLVELDASL